MADNAPGCFGYITTHDISSKHCKDCGFEPQCAQEAYNAGLEIQKVIDIEADLSAYTSRTDLVHEDKPEARRQPHYKGAARVKKTPTAITDTHAKLIAQLPEKARRVANQCVKKSIDVCGELRAKRNPSNDKKLSFMRVICAIAKDGPFTRSQLEQELSRKFTHWTKDTVSSHANTSIQVLRLYGLQYDANLQRYYLSLE